MLLPIVQYGDPILREKCATIETVDDEIRTLAENMIETMVEANGVGLAAPQIGVGLRLAVVDVSHDPECVSYLTVNGEEKEIAEIMPLIFINPTLEYGEQKEIDYEGCLSIEGIRSEVRRPADVKATLPQLDGSTLVIETDGLLSRALQHEIDHLNGILFTDRLSAVGKVSVRNRLKRLVAAR